MIVTAPVQTKNPQRVSSFPKVVGNIHSIQNPLEHEMLFSPEALAAKHLSLQSIWLPCCEADQEFWKLPLKANTV
jgi:hypothetical protein